MFILRLLLIWQIFIKSKNPKHFNSKPYARKVFEYKSKRTYYLFYNGQIEVHFQDSR